MSHGRKQVMTLAINKFMLSVNIIGGRDKQRTKSFEILASGVDDATKRSIKRSYS
jgi:hypothetical protein